MKLSKACLAASPLVLLVLMGFTSCSKTPETRSVASVPLPGSTASPKFSREAATGLFVGVREFGRDGTLEVPYAVDDAVDLAYRFSLDQRVALIPPRRVVLVLSGMPQKDDSKRRLRELKDAGARIERNATSDDLLQLLRQQAASAGRDGLFILSIASHGFQQNGDAYILGPTSVFGSPETSLRAADLYDIAAQALRSLIFIDACRDRVVQDSRGVAPDPMAAAQQIRRMSKVRGQVIFYAAAPGEYAFDDPVNRNGVFTKAVLDGLDCQASAPRGTVVVETLHSFVDRAVRRWILENKKKTVNPATQISMEGETRNMPLCECWRPKGPDIRVAVDRSIVTAYGEDTRPLWRKDFGTPIVDAMAADLDADALQEIVVGLRHRIVVFDRDGRQSWIKKNDTASLQAFTTGDLFEKHTRQVVTLWNENDHSRLTVLDPDGGQRSSFAYPGRLLRIAVGRPTKMHGPKIVVASSNSLLLFHPRKLARGIPIWRQALRSAAAEAIESLQILSVKDSSRQDIAVATAEGTTWFDFDGKLLKQNTNQTSQKGRGR